MTTYYKTCAEESCVEEMSPMFRQLGCQDSVTASIFRSDGVGVSHSCFLGIYNHLESSNMWKKNEPWVTEVEYTIPHPEGDVVAFDTKSERDATLRSTSVQKKMIGYTNDKLWGVTLTRTTAVNYDEMDLNAQRFSRVKIMNTKRFLYETERSSWVYKLAVSWEGVTKEEAKCSEMRYSVQIETNDNRKASVDPSYSTASLLEKVLDIVSQGKRRGVLEFDKNLL
jgi:hypothetical protein